MFTPQELAAVGLTEERAVALYGESSVQVCRTGHSTSLLYTVIVKCIAEINLG